MNSALKPEWSAVRAIVIAWPYEDSDWQDNYAQAEQCYWAMLTAFSTYSDVWVLLHSSISKAQWLENLEKEFGRSAANARRCAVSIIDSIDYDDTWIRDYGPLTTHSDYVSFCFNGWGGKYPAALDTLVGKKLQPWLGGVVRESEYFFEGGALEINDSGVLLANKDCVIDSHRNPGLNQAAVEAVLAKELGVKAFAWLEGIQLTGDDTDGHIDTIARYVANDSVVYSGPNPSHPDAAALQALKSQISALAAEHNWQLAELPTPIVYSQVEEGQLLPATYANFLICNDVVFVPVYGVSEDQIAVDVLTTAMPNKTIVTVRCEALLEQHGSLHCATMQIGTI